MGKKVCITLHRKPVSELWSTSCHMGSHSITWHKSTCSALIAARQTNTQLTYPGAMW